MHLSRNCPFSDKTNLHLELPGLRPVIFGVEFSVEIASREVTRTPNVRSEKSQNESFPNFSNPRPEFCPEFSPNFSRTFRASFHGRRRPEKFTKNPPPFFNAKSPGKCEKNIHNFFFGEVQEATNASTRRRNLTKLIGEVAALRVSALRVSSKEVQSLLERSGELLLGVVLPHLPVVEKFPRFLNGLKQIKTDYNGLERTKNQLKIDQTQGKNGLKLISAGDFTRKVG